MKMTKTTKKNKKYPHNVERKRPYLSAALCHEQISREKIKKGTPNIVPTKNTLKYKAAKTSLNSFLKTCLLKVISQIIVQ
jgi:hypothetical protein